MIDSQTSKLVLVLCLLSFTAAVLVAWLNPAASYEPSIYTGTPPLFWILLASSIFGALVVAVNGTYSDWRYVATGIVIAAMISIILLPVIRGYWLHGSGDTLTILGYLQDSTQRGGIRDQLYPAMLAIPLILSEVLRISWNHSMMLTPAIFATLFTISIPLLIRSLGFRQQTVVAAGMLSALFLPINLVATHLMFHPNSMTILFSSFAIFAVFLCTKRDGLETRTTLLLILTAAVFFHPQQALSLVAVVMTIGTVQFMLQQIESVPSPQSRPLITISFASGTIWMFWLFVQEGFDSHIAWTIIGFLRAGSASPTAGRSGTFGALDISLLEMAVRLFALDFIIIILVIIGIIVAATWLLNHLDLIETDFTPNLWSQEQTFAGVCLTASLLPVIIIFVFFLFSGVSQQFMRVVGFLMMLGTILAAFGFDKFYDQTRAYTDRFATRQLILVFMLTLLLLAGATAHSSDFIYRESYHVTETSMDGYSTALEYHDETTEMLSLRRHVWRYTTALEGVQGDPMIKYTGTRRENQPPDNFANQSLKSHYDSDKQLVVTEADRYLEAELYNGLRQSKDDFAYLEREPGISRQYDNGEVQWYYIQADSSS